MSFVGPRPIALVTTLSPEGIVNAAPMSFFNVFAQSPPLLILGLQDREGVRKDTTRNILATREFVVNLVDEPIAKQMVVCAVEFPPDVDEEMRQLMASGNYGSPDEVLRAALDALKRHDVEVAAIQQGIDDMEAGRVSSLREFDREFRRRKNIGHDQ